ncbi:MAG: hypothetical protein CMC46_03715 [Flavobacteriaceae bacterium]|nr:hypothetical protein [Flavobacteriaceae bacterium]
MIPQNKDEYIRESLSRLFNDISLNQNNLDFKKIRVFCASKISKIFSNVDHIFKGSEYLPYETNSIFIYNHLNNHQFYTVANNFQITLDSHFISSNILYKYYNSPGNRVVRCSLPHEKSHQDYYSKFNYIRVFAQNFIPVGTNYKQIKNFNRNFYDQSKKSLENGEGIIVSPEGFSLDTNNSPGDFKLGVFKLAAMVKPQPKIVPIVNVNFESLISNGNFKCEIKQPFKMSDHGIYSPDDIKISSFVKDFNKKYKSWVNDLSIEDLNFESEIKKLLIKSKNVSKTENQIIFYGSSTIRLWVNLKKDFPSFNVLNFGFGGALISSLSKYFKSIFENLNPSVLVLYMGGNDLTRFDSYDMIVSKQLKFIEKIGSIFPNTIIINFSIKPSFERLSKIPTIKKINKKMSQESRKNKKFIQIDFFEKFFENNKLCKKYFLQDGLHLSLKGYQILQNEIFSFLKNSYLK